MLDSIIYVYIVIIVYHIIVYPACRAPIACPARGPCDCPEGSHPGYRRVMRIYVSTTATGDMNRRGAVISTCCGCKSGDYKCQ